MTRKEVQTIITANPGKRLFILSGAKVPSGHLSITLHDPVSKTKALKCAKFIHSVRYTTFGEERPDLAQYLNRPNGAKNMGWNDPIVTFDATS